MVCWVPALWLSTVLCTSHRPPQRLASDDLLLALQASNLTEVWDSVLQATGCEQLVSFLQSLLTYDPQQRADASLIMQHPYLQQPPVLPIAALPFAPPKACINPPALETLLPVPGMPATYYDPAEPFGVAGSGTLHWYACCSCRRCLFLGCASRCRAPTWPFACCLFTVAPQLCMLLHTSRRCMVHAQHPGNKLVSLLRQNVVSCIGLV